MHTHNLVIVIAAGQVEALQQEVAKANANYASRTAAFEQTMSDLKAQFKAARFFYSLHEQVADPSICCNIGILLVSSRRQPCLVLSDRPPVLHQSFMWCTSLNQAIIGSLRATAEANINNIIVTIHADTKIHCQFLCSINLKLNTETTK